MDKRGAIKLSNNAMLLLNQRYLLKDNKGRIIETPEQMFHRVAKAIAKVDKRYGGDVRYAEDEFYEMMANLDFLPNSPTLMNAGTELGQLAACFVLPIEDSIDSIFSTLKDMAVIHQSGGGTGFNFSRIRHSGSLVRTSKGKASGPVSFLEIYNKATDVIKQGGKRRGANMAILSVDHPDILEFVKIKQWKQIENFNLSVSVTDKFMKAVVSNGDFDLVDPNDKKVVVTVKARWLFNQMIDAAWKTGDPGMIFVDEINRKNMLKLGRIESTNPCGEVPLYPFESCVLGSINLSNVVNADYIDWEKLRKTVFTAVHFLDNVIDASKYPFDAVEKMAKANRKIGLGVMGFADMLIKLEVAYDSEEAIVLAEKVMTFINHESKRASMGLADRRGAFPNFSKSRFKHRIRNATTTTVAPTGSLSLIADTTPSIEPLFAVNYRKMILGKKGIVFQNRQYSKLAVKYKGDKAKLKNLFKTAYEIRPEQHIKIQAAFQEFTDNAVSKTVNLSSHASRKDVEKIFLLAYALKCKGITVYRQGSHKEEVIKECKECKV